jgi:hypothetical protein
MISSSVGSSRSVVTARIEREVAVGHALNDPRTVACWCRDFPEHLAFHEWNLRAIGTSSRDEIQRKFITCEACSASRGRVPCASLLAVFWIARFIMGRNVSHLPRTLPRWDESRQTHHSSIAFSNVALAPRRLKWTNEPVMHERLRHLRKRSMTTSSP